MKVHCIIIIIVSFFVIPWGMSETFVPFFGDGPEGAKIKRMTSSEWMPLKISKESNREATDSMALLKFDLKMLNDGRPGGAGRLFLEGDLKGDELILKRWFMIVPFVDEDMKGVLREQGRLSKDHFVANELSLLPPYGIIKLAKEFKPDLYSRKLTQINPNEKNANIRRR